MFKIRKNFRSEKITFTEDARNFVYNHRNIMNDTTRRYIERRYPAPIVKEIGTFEGKKYYTYWVFVPCRYGTLIYIVENKDEAKKLTSKQLNKVCLIQDRAYQVLNDYNNQAKVKKLFS